MGSSFALSTKLSALNFAAGISLLSTLYKRVMFVRLYKYGVNPFRQDHSPLANQDNRATIKRWKKHSVATRANSVGPRYRTHLRCHEGVQHGQAQAILLGNLQHICGQADLSVHCERFHLYEAEAGGTLVEVSFMDDRQFYLQETPVQVDDSGMCKE